MKKKDNMDVTPIVGDEHMYCILSKVSDDNDGWVKTTMAHEIVNVGCLITVTTRQKNDDKTYSVAEAITFIHGARIVGDGNNGNKLVVNHSTRLA